MEGIDIFEGNTGMPPWIEVSDAGYRFVFHRTNELGPGSTHQADARFTQRWPELQYAGVIRSTFDLVINNAGSAEYQGIIAGMVHQLGPGDLGPSLDMEDRDPAHTGARSQTIEAALHASWINQNFNDDCIDGTGIVNLNFDSGGNPDSAKVVAPLVDKIAVALIRPMDGAGISALMDLDVVKKVCKEDACACFEGGNVVRKNMLDKDPQASVAYFPAMRAPARRSRNSCTNFISGAVGGR